MLRRFTRLTRLVSPLPRVAIQPVIPLVLKKPHLLTSYNFMRSLLTPADSVPQKPRDLSFSQTHLLKELTELQDKEAPQHIKDLRQFHQEQLNHLQYLENYKNYLLENTYRGSELIAIMELNAFMYRIERCQSLAALREVLNDSKSQVVWDEELIYSIRSPEDEIAFRRTITKAMIETRKDQVFLILDHLYDIYLDIQTALNAKINEFFENIFKTRTNENAEAIYDEMRDLRNRELVQYTYENGTCRAVFVLPAAVLDFITQDWGLGKKLDKINYDTLCEALNIPLLKEMNENDQQQAGKAPSMRR